MTQPVKFVSVTRTIDPKTGIHYMDALDENGIHYMAQMDHKTEPHLCYTKVWYEDPQQPKIYVKAEPYKDVRANWEEKDNPKPMDEVVDKLVKEYQYQKLYNRVRDQLGYSIDCCDEIVDLVEDWILDEQSASGSQNVNTELLVEGFNDAIRKMKEMLR